MSRKKLRKLCGLKGQERMKLLSFAFVEKKNAAQQRIKNLKCHRVQLIPAAFADLC